MGTGGTGAKLVFAGEYRQSRLLEKSKPEFGKNS